MKQPEAIGTDNTCDVFVIGGGPAGSTVAALLAARGWQVVVAEKERHPRFHIGESLLPMNIDLFERLGVFEQVENISIYKYGAELNSSAPPQSVTLEFCDAWDKSRPFAFQVRRSELDQVLFDNCIARGARAMQECRVTGVSFPTESDGGGVEVGGVEIMVQPRDEAAQRWRARYLIDASGRDTFVANRLGIKQRNRRHASAALYGHFSGARRLPGKAEGNISLFWFEHGWFWSIPLLDGSTSVGAVCSPQYLRSRQSHPTTFFLETIQLCPALAERLTEASLIAPATATGNYSYESRQMFGDRFILLGDAFAFVDPVFSSGVFLAMNSAFLGADVVDGILRNPSSEPALQRRFQRTVHHGLKQFSWFIHRMTRPAMRNLFLAPRNSLRMQEALLSLLAGDLFRGTPIYRSLAAFKMVYYLNSAMQLKQTISAWRQSRRAISALATEAETR